MSKRPQYCNNKEFYERLTSWLDETKDQESPKIPDDIALTIMRICENLGRSGRFKNYTWLDDMIADAIYCCIKGIRNFNPEKSSNPFSFYTAFAWNAFIKRINTEKTRLVALQDYKENLTDLYYTDRNDDFSYIDTNAHNANMEYLKEKKKKIKKDLMEEFL